MSSPYKYSSVYETKSAEEDEEQINLLCDHHVTPCACIHASDVNVHALSNFGHIMEVCQDSALDYDVSIQYSAAEHSSSESSPIQTVGGNTYKYTALTSEVLTHHQHHHTASTAIGTHHMQQFNAEHTSPYGRYSGYIPNFQEVNNESAAKPRPEVSTQQDHALSYGNTYPTSATVVDEAPSDSCTIRSTHNDVSSIQAEAEVEQYTYAHTTYWNGNPLGYQQEDLEQKISYLGAHFDIGDVQWMAKNE